MKGDTFHEILRHLEEVREDLSHDAQNRAAVEGIDQAIAKLRQAHDAGEIGNLSARELLRHIADILSRLGPIASLIETILKSL